MLADIKEYISTRIKNVSGIDADTVHEFPRHTNEWSEIYTLFKDDNGNINTWLIRFVAAPAEWYEHRTQYYNIMREWRFQVWALYSLKESETTATTFETLVEGVLNELSKSPGGSKDGQAVNETVDLMNPAQLINLDEVMFTNILCHRAQIEVSAKELIYPNHP